MKMAGIFAVTTVLGAEARNCNSECKSKYGWSGYVVGTAPLCHGVSSDCGSDIVEGFDTKWEDGGHTCADGQKVCCCHRNSQETEVPAETETEADTDELSATVGTQTRNCNSECQDKYGWSGYVVGTAPMCHGVSSDCHNDIAEGFDTKWEDGGHTCADGQKVCCCRRNSQETEVSAEDTSAETESEAEQELSATVGAQARNCNSECKSKYGWSGYVVGTAPLCHGVSSDCGSDIVEGFDTKWEDGGHTCADGQKVCCCHRNGDTVV